MEYKYAPDFYPPAPVLDVEVTDPLQTKKNQRIKCQLDTGADITVIPNKTISSLRIPLIKVIPVEDYQGKTEDKEVYLARIFFCNREFIVKIVATPEDTGLIGRDILNQWIILLDGQEERFSLTQKVWRLWNLLITKT